jgi:processive 1,2-diacylglycerol beta-glucosyltransferase
MDAMKMLGRRGESSGEAVLRAMLGVPGLFDAVHYSALRTGNRLARAADVTRSALAALDRGQASCSRAGPIAG